MPPWVTVCCHLTTALYSPEVSFLRSVILSQMEHSSKHKEAKQLWLNDRTFDDGDNICIDDRGYQRRGHDKGVDRDLARQPTTAAPKAA